MSDLSLVKFITHRARLSFPSFHEPKIYPNRKPDDKVYYEGVLLFTRATDLKKPAAKTWKDGAPMPSMYAAGIAAVMAKFGSDPSKIPKNLIKPYTDGNDKPDLLGYADMIAVKVKSKDQPGALDENKKTVKDIKNKFYAGCWVRCELIAYAYDYAGKKGYGFNVQNIMFDSDDEKFSGRRSPADAFSGFESENASADDEANYESAADPFM